MKLIMDDVGHVQRYGPFTRDRTQITKKRICQIIGFYGAREVTFHSFYYCVLSNYYVVLSNYYVVLSNYYCDISK